MSSRIAESEFKRICEGIRDDREAIIKHNPIGTPEETLLWMLMSTLVVYLSLTEIETPCFTGVPDAETYRQAIHFIINEGKAEGFEIDPYLIELVSK